MKTSIEFIPNNETANLISPWHKSRKSAFEDKILKPEYEARRLRFEQGPTWFRILPATLNVRILTRSPLAKRDFDLFKSFGPRLAFGMSLPTLCNDLAKAYEPNAPAPTQRLATLNAAKEAGLNVYVAMAPTFPECDEVDLRRTLEAVREVNPITVFHEPINVRASNAQRIAQHASALVLLCYRKVVSA